MNNNYPLNYIFCRENPNKYLVSQNSIPYAYCFVFISYKIMSSCNVVTISV